MSDIQPILCSKCKVTPERGFERDGETWAACPICGQEDRVADIQREAALYNADKGVRGVLADLRGSSFTVKSAPQREYRWIVGE